MNFGLLLTYVVGGLLMLSVLIYSNSLFNSSAETSTSVVTQSKLDNIVDIFQNDLTRIGYNVANPDITPVFITADDSVLEFRGDIFEDSSDDFDVVKWEILSTADTTTTNPNDRILRRTWNNTPSNPLAEEVFEYSATYLHFDYFDIEGNAPANVDSIRQVEVQLMVESDEPFAKSRIGSDDIYYKTTWKRRIVITNLVFSGSNF